METLLEKNIRVIVRKKFGNRQAGAETLVVFLKEHTDSMLPKNYLRLALGEFKNTKFIPTCARVNHR